MSAEHYVLQESIISVEFNYAKIICGGAELASSFTQSTITTRFVMLCTGSLESWSYVMHDVLKWLALAPVRART